ncbi:hypothetical protein D1B17_07005 [Companilactobacillus zhachilii]|uniref:Uncharacterized protein n=1 Tax=Companilactobacillus zhachilii TaxID=2304606 RepID=A0A386PVA8_9LACO|nr:hypothetical protein [Companilactobacillus zhachilii]AYE38397.1 hypothetical protein D1B17_07005 [Companilactobacillus zhachilii]
MVENAITKVARIAANALQGLFYKDSSGKIHKIPTDDKNFGDITGLIGNGSGGDTGGGDNSDHPSAGADYYAGSLADGEITERYLLYQRDESVAEEPTTSKTVTLLRDVGTKFNMAGDGATFLLHLQKTVMTAGAKGDVSDIELNYDTSNAVKEGYFTTTSVYPVYIKSADLATTNELDIPINGIGENLQEGKNFLAPHLKVKFNGDGTMTYYSVTGYDNDGNSAGVTGANYDVVVDVIATFSTQKPVAQLPSSINFFTGQAVGQIALAGTSDYYENSMDGLELAFDEYSYHYRDLSANTLTGKVLSSDLGMKRIIKIPKEKLIIGYKFSIPFNSWPSTTASINWWDKTNDGWSNSGHSTPQTANVAGPSQSTIIVNKDSIVVDYTRSLKMIFGSKIVNYEYYDQVDKITSYKN